jgi:hypothetical protein
MVKVRNRLLTLLAIVVVGLAASRGVAQATIMIDWNDPSDVVGPSTGEPDTPATKKTSATNTPTVDGTPVVTRALWSEWAIRVWAAMHLGAGL